jgi:hypothetical protein
LHSEEIHGQYSSPNIIRKIIPRRMRWAGHVARTGHRKIAYRILVEKLEKKRGHLEDLGVDGRIILNRVLQK